MAWPRGSWELSAPLTGSPWGRECGGTRAHCTGCDFLSATARVGVQTGSGRWRARAGPYRGLILHLPTAGCGGHRTSSGADAWTQAGLRPRSKPAHQPSNRPAHTPQPSSKAHVSGSEEFWGVTGHPNSALGCGRRDEDPGQPGQSQQGKLEADVTANSHLH